MILSELLYKLVLFCDIVRVGKNSYCEFDKFIEDNGYCNDFSDSRLHHEIYMSDARKVPPEKWKTVIRHPICKL